MSGVNKETEDRIEEIAKHKVNNHLTMLWFDVGEFKVTQKYMTDKLDKLERAVVDWFKEIWAKIEKQDEKNELKYATKIEHSSNADRLKRVENAIIWVVVLFITGIIWAIIKLVLK